MWNRKELVLEVSKKMTAQCNVLFKLPYLKEKKRDFPGGPVVNNLPSNAEDAGSIPGQGHAVWQLNPQWVTQLETAAPKLN